MAEFFISYARVDQPVVDPLVDRLKSIFGFDNVWIDRKKIRTGDQLRPTIEKAIIECSFFIYLLSPKSIKSSTCKWELKIAKQQGKEIFPVKLIAFDDSEIPKHIKEYLYTDLSSDTDNKNFDGLLFSIFSKRDEIRERQQTFRMLSDITLPTASSETTAQINFNELFYGKENERFQAIRGLSVYGVNEVKAWIAHQEKLEHYRNLPPNEKSAIPPDKRPEKKPCPPLISGLIGLLFDEDATLASESLSVFQYWNLVTYIPSLLNTIIASAASTGNSRFHNQVVEFVDQAVDDVAELEKYRNALNILGGETVVDVLSEFDKRITSRNRTVRAAEAEEKARSINLNLHPQLFDLIVDYAVEPKIEYSNDIEKHFVELELSTPTLQLYKQLFINLGLDDFMIQLIDSFIDAP